ncbi:MAG: hypothetical protein ACR65X_16115 [Methylocystis sp.]
MTAWRDEASSPRGEVTRAEAGASPELRQASRRGRSGPRRPVFVDGVRLGRLALWT